MGRQYLAIRALRRVGVVGALVATMLVGTSSTPALGDTGCPTAAAPTLVSGSYEINTAAKLQWLRESAAVSGAMSNTYKLTADISMTGCTWTAGIGTTGTPFSGTFDGNGKTISNLTVNNTFGNPGIALISYLTGTVTNVTLSSPTVTGTSNNVGALVGEVRATGSVSNITLTSVSISGGQQTGGAVGKLVSGSTLHSVSVSGSVSAPNDVGGGVAGTSEGTLTNITSTATVTGGGSLGGLVGTLNYAGTITNGSSSGNVTGTGGGVGGAVGSAAGVSPSCGTINDVTTSGQISSTSYVAGILGYGNCFFINRSSSSATVTGSSSGVGGILGYDNNAGTITKSFFTGQAQGTQQVGGIAGATRSTISDSYSTGTVTATATTNGSRAGGFVGMSLSTASFSRSFATGSVTAPASATPKVGGFIGEYASGTITSSIWNTLTTGQSSSASSSPKGYTTQQMRDYVLYNADNLNWNIADGHSNGDGINTGSTWSICSGANSGYPYLTWQQLSGTCQPTMAYVGNGNTGGTAPSDASTPYTSGDTVTVLGNTGSLTKTSNNFAGWNTKADGSGTSYSPGDTFSITSPVLLFAVWSVTPQITYNSNGGSGSIANTSGASGASVTLSSGVDFARTGYALSRWDTSAAGTGTSYSKSQVITMPGGGLTLYAIWTALPGVTYNSNGGTGTIATSYATAGASVTLSSGSSFARTGFTLSRWDTLANGTGTSYSKSQSVSMPAGGLTLYAVWTANATTTTSTTTTTTVAPTTSTAAPGSTTTTVARSNSGTTTTTTAVVSESQPPGTSSLPPGVTAAPVVPGVGTPTVTTPRQTTTTIAEAVLVERDGVSVAAPPTFPTTTSVPSASSTSTPGSGGSAPDVEGVGPGQTGATVDGQPAVVNVEEDNGSLVVSVAGTRVRYTVISSSGAQRSVSAASALTLSPGDRVRVDFTGFAATAQAKAWITPGDVLLGEVALVDGVGSVEGVIPNDATSGERRLVSEAESATGKPIVVAHGVTVAANDSQGASWSLVFLIIVGIAIAAGLLVPAARRRRNDES